MALSHGRPYQKSAFAMNFLRPSLYINGEMSPTSSSHHNDSRRHSGDSAIIASNIWRQVYESIVASSSSDGAGGPDYLNLDAPTASATTSPPPPPPISVDIGGRRTSEINLNTTAINSDASTSSSSPTYHPMNTSITRQLAFGNTSSTENASARCNNHNNSNANRKHRGCRCDCDRRTCITMFASVAIVAVCFAGTLLLRVKEMEVERRLFESWLRGEVNKNRSNFSSDLVMAKLATHGGDDNRRYQKMALDDLAAISSNRSSSNAIVVESNDDDRNN